MTALLIYEDFEGATRSKAILERAVGRVDPGERWNLKLWRRDVLSLSAAAAEALTESLEAEFLVLALKQPESPAWTLMEWLDKWATRRQVQEAALVVMRAGEVANRGVQATPGLAKFAASHGLGFLLDESGSDRIELGPMVHNMRQTVARTRQFRPAWGWGINE